MNERRFLMKYGLGVICLFLLAACVPSQGAGQTVVIHQDQEGEVVKIPNKSTFTVSLPGNPTTGYSWEVSEGDDQILQQDGEWSFTADSKKIGAPGMFSLPFKTAGAGKTTLKLIYHRSFEKDVAPLNTFTVTILVEE
jgi:inhibitor of cysteine peptidase